MVAIKNLGPLSRELGIELRETFPDRVVAVMQVSDKHHQPFGSLHGGANVVLAETVASVGAKIASREGHYGVGMEINANHMRPVKEGTLTAEAVPLHTGTNSHVWEVKIRDRKDRLVCASRCTLAIREVSPGK